MRAPPRKAPPPGESPPAEPETLPAHTIERTSMGLRNALFDQLDALRAGKISPTMANSFARLAEQVVRTVELEITVEKTAAYLQKRGEKLFDILPPNLPLGDREDAKQIDLDARWHEPKDE